MNQFTPGHSEDTIARLLIYADMILSDFFPWGYLKSLIYETPVESEIDLVAKMVIAAENARVFERVRQSILKRYQTYIDVGGGYLNQLL